MTKQHKYHLKYSLIFSGIIIFILVCVWYDFFSKPTYQKYISTSQPSTVRVLRSRDALSKRFEYDLSYRQGCHNCMKMQSTIAPLLKQAKQRHDKLLVLDANHKPLHAYLDRTQQDDFPTVALRYRGYLIYQYSGMNRQIFKDIFHGINPQTKHKFSHRIPHNATIINDYAQSKKHVPSYETFDDYK